jgi:predicted nucleic acid-binding protein
MDLVDTNVLLYRVSFAESERAKQQTAARIMERDDLCLSVQVLQEFYVQATRSSRDDALEHEEACDLIASCKRSRLQETTKQALDAALAARKRWKLSYWDAAIIEAASLSGCSLVLTEDLTDGQEFDGVNVKNPFATL